MRIAISGGTGFLGKYVIECLEEKKIDCLVLTRNKKSEVGVYTDYSEESLAEILKGVDGVVHLAAKRGSQGLISEFHSNEILTQNIYETCYKLNIKNIVNASSISVYSDESLLPWKEDQVLQPINMYGLSKLTCEYIGDIYNKKGMNIKNLRFAHLYGLNEKNNYMINLFLRKAFNKKELVVKGKSLAKREFLYAKDAAKAIYKALIKEDVSGTFNIGSGCFLTNLEVADTINQKFNNKENLILEQANEDEGIQSSYMSSDLALKMLDFENDYDFSKAIEEIYSYMMEGQNVPIFY